MGRKPSMSGGRTVAQVADAFGLKHRQFYMVREVFRELERADFDPVLRAELEERMKNGTITALGALKLAKPDKYRAKTRLQKLAIAWDLASPGERATVIALSDDIGLSREPEN